MNKKERILKSAFELFCKNGFGETDIDSIAKKAEVAKGTVYLYFSSKNELFMKSMMYVFEEYDRQISILVDEKLTYREKLYAYISLNINTMFENNVMSKMLVGELYNVLKKENALKKSVLKEKMSLKFKDVENLINAGIKSGEFKKVDSASVSAMILGGTNMLLMRNIYISKTNTKESNIEIVIKNLTETIFMLLDKEVK